MKFETSEQHLPQIENTTVTQEWKLLVAFGDHLQGLQAVLLLVNLSLNMNYAPPHCSHSAVLPNFQPTSTLDTWSPPIRSSHQQILSWSPETRSPPPIWEFPLVFYFLLGSKHQRLYFCSISLALLTLSHSILPLCSLSSLKYTLMVGFEINGSEGFEMDYAKEW